MSRPIVFLALCISLAPWRAAMAEPTQREAAKDEAAPAGKLPWRDRAPPPRLPGKRFENAREFLELLGVDASQWNNLFHDQPLSAADEEWINRILFHLPRVGG